MQNSTLVVVGDIGGTNIRLRLVEIKRDSHKRLKQQFYLVSNYDTFEQAVLDFLKGSAGDRKVKIGVFAMAGPVQDRSILMSNVLKWGLLQQQKLQKSIGLESVKLLNDFQAISYGLQKVSQKDVISLNGLKPNPALTRVVLGPGTGLGTSIIVQSEGQSRVLACQGGHVDPICQCQEDLEFIAYLAERRKKAIVLQNQFCGTSIPFLYEFYSVNKKVASKSAEDILKAIQTDSVKASKTIIQLGVSGKDQVSTLVVDYIWRIYTKVIANFSMNVLPKGGIHLIGSLTMSLLKAQIHSQRVMQKVKENREYMASVLDKIPLLVIDVQDLGLKGARVIAQRIAISLNLI